MSQYRKLGRPTDQRIALLRGQVTELLNKGKIITTDTRAKEVRSIAEKLITLAVRECENTVEATKSTQNDKKQTVEITVKNDAPSRLHARPLKLKLFYSTGIAGSLFVHTKNSHKSNCSCGSSRLHLQNILLKNDQDT